MTQISRKTRVKGILLGVGIYFLLLLFDIIAQPSDSTTITFVIIPIGVIISGLYVYARYDIYKASKSDETDLMNAEVGDTVEVSGTVTSISDPIKSPFYDKTVCFCHYSIEELTGYGAKRREIWDTRAVGFDSTQFTVATPNQQKNAIINFGSDIYTNPLQANHSDNGIHLSLQNLSTQFDISIHSRLDISDILLTEDVEKTVLQTDDSKPSEISKFESTNNLTETVSDDSGGVITTEKGSRKYTEERISKNDTVYVRGKVTHTDVMSPITVETAEDDLSIIADTPRKSYIERESIGIYAAFTLIVLGILTWIPSIV